MCKYAKSPEKKVVVVERFIQYQTCVSRTIRVFVKICGKTGNRICGNQNQAAILIIIHLTDTIMPNKSDLENKTDLDTWLQQALNITRDQTIQIANVKHQETLNLIREENQAAINKISSRTGDQLQSFHTVISQRCDQSDAKTATLEEKLNSLANQITSSTVSSSNTSLTVSNSTPASSSANMERIRHVGYHLRKAELDQLGLPYYVKQGYYPKVEEVLELERYMTHSRLLIGFHPITMDDVQTTK